jgi:hypothetical protein
VLTGPASIGGDRWRRSIMQGAHMQIRTSLGFTTALVTALVTALAVGLAACSKQAEAPATTQTAQTTTPGKGPEAEAGPGTTTNFESQSTPAQPAPNR